MARQYAVEVYQITRYFPEEEKYGMITQMRRSARSVPANIAEGSTRFSQKEQSHFYSIAFGSVIEILNDLILAVDLEYITEEQLASHRARIEIITRTLSSLRKSLNGPPNIP